MSDLQDLTITQLKKKAKELGLVGYSKYRKEDKDELIELIEERMKEEKEEKSEGEEPEEEEEEEEEEGEGEEEEELEEEEEEEEETEEDKEYLNNLVKKMRKKSSKKEQQNIDKIMNQQVTLQELCTRGNIYEILMYTPRKLTKSHSKEEILIMWQNAINKFLLENLYVAAENGEEGVDALAFIKGEQMSLSDTNPRDQILENFEDISGVKIDDNAVDKNYITSLIEIIKTTEETTEEGEHKERAFKPSVTGKKIVFSGFRDEELKFQIDESGGQVVTSVSSKTDILVVKDKSKSTGKIEKAKELGIKVMSKKEFEEYMDRVLSGGITGHTYGITMTFSYRLGDGETPRPTLKEIKEWYRNNVILWTETLGVIEIESIKVAKNTIVLKFYVNTEKEIDDEYLFDFGMLCDPDDDGNYPIRGWSFYGDDQSVKRSFVEVGKREINPTTKKEINEAHARLKAMGGEE